MRRFLVIAGATVLITMAARLDAAGAPTVTASATALTFSWQVAAKLPAAQNVSVRISSGTPAYTVTTPGSDPWLIATPSAGVLPATLAVQVNPSTLSPGTHVSAVTVTVTGIASPTVIPVTLTVSSGSTAPSVTPTTLALTSPGNLTGAFTVSAGQLPATFTATSSVAFLTLSANTGALLPAQSQTITVTANATGIAPAAAAKSGKITVVTTVNGVATTQTVTVNFTVNPVTPVVTSVWPAQIPVGSPDTVVTIVGANFYTATTVAATGSATPLKTTIVAGNVLLATLPAPLLAAAGGINVTVSNPAPGGSAAPVVVTVGNVSTISGVTNAASYAGGAVSPGEFIAIFGQNIGPQVPVTLYMVNSVAQTNVGGVTVMIDAVAAPIIYASSSQVSVQVPYAASLGTARTLTLTNGTATPATTNVDIVSSAPGLFTLNASGAGPALVLNYNAGSGTYSVNSATNPAAVGSTVVFFITGEGDYASSDYAPETGVWVPTTPPIATGVYPQISPLPTVNIGGAIANVSYAGPIPGSLVGLMQLNVVVPAGGTTGAAVPLSVTVGSNQTQANVTIAIR